MKISEGKTFADLSLDHSQMTHLNLNTMLNQTMKVTCSVLGEKESLTVIKSFINFIKMLIGASLSSYSSLE